MIWVMSRLSIWLMLLLPLPLVAADSADVAATQPADKATHDAVMSLIRTLSADSFAERETATAALIEKDKAAMPDLTSTLSKCEDPEIRTRLSKIIAAIEEAPFLGEYVQVAYQSIAQGRARDEQNVQSSLTVEKGKVVWKLRVHGRDVTQSYTFDGAKTTFKGETEVKLQFEKMDDPNNMYSPESGDPRLLLRNTPRGVSITFVGTDGGDVTSTVQFTPKKKE
jgi:hypothetical protein